MVQKHKLILIISVVIIVSISLIAIYRFTDFLQGSIVVSDTITLDVVSWNMSRQSDCFRIEENVTNIYTDDASMLVFNVRPIEYYERDGTWNYNDVLGIVITASAEVNSGYIYSMNVNFSNIDENAFLEIFENEYWMDLSNVTKRKIIDGSCLRDGFFETVGTNHPRQCAIELRPHWVFFDADGINHQIRITLQTIHFNGTHYRQIIIPVQLGVLCAQVSGDTVLRFEPQERIIYVDTTTVGYNYTMCVIAENVKDFYGWEFILKWTPDVIHCTSETLNLDIWGLGDFLGPWVTDPMDNVDGEYHQSLTGKPPSASVNGTFWLVNLTFQILANLSAGETPFLAISHAPGYIQYCLLDAEALEIPHGVDATFPEFVIQNTTPENR